jgi:hypothetical protein
MAALAATLEGSLGLVVRDGVLVGLDLAALQAAALAEPGPDEAAMRQALAGGGSAFDRLEAAAQVTAGRASLTAGTVVTQAGGEAGLSGDIDLARATLDLRLAARPVAEAPAIGLRLTGPMAEPRRLPELAPFLRWRAER